MSLASVGGMLLGFILLLLGVFQGGKISGKKVSRIDQLEDEVELLHEYEKIDATPDVADPFSLLSK